MVKQAVNRHSGLTPREVEESRSRHGSNLLTPPRRTSVWRLYLDKYNDPIIRILLVAALISLGIGIYENEYVETIGILVAILLATTIGFYFEWDAARKFDILNALGQEEPVTVVRDGGIVRIARSQIVVGDIVLLQQGDEVPADGRLVEATGMMLNESSLTGEPSARKTADPSQMDSEATYPSDMLLRSTMVIDGHGTMCVTAVGDHTEIGKVARETAADTDIDTPLNQQLNRLGSVISKWSFAISIAVFIICIVHGSYLYWSGLAPGESVDWLVLGERLLGYFMIAVTLIVMAVPEGLPMAISLSLALNMRRMLRTNNLVRKMHASETMGAVTVICTDKTGTLTQNRMTLTELHTYNDADSAVRDNIAVNSTAHLQADGTGVGNPTEAALLAYLRRQGCDYQAMRRQARIVDQMAFSTERKMMATLVAADDGRLRLFVKGAPEIVMQLCLADDRQQSDFRQRLAGYQQRAMRTLAFASVDCEEVADIRPTCESLIQAKGLTLQAIAGITDPVREEVPAAVAQCMNAGISVKVITGDNAGTAIQIAREIGLWTDQDSDRNTITGPEWAALSDDEALERVDSLKVISRARPLDKQRVVSMLQRRGHVVAVTGDGTNDAPALHQAQVGLSMGSGTAVSKEASDITLIDDSFRSIATAVIWGRSLYKNIQRFLCFQLTVSLSALAISIVGALFGTEMPLTVMQILWINLIMDTFAALALSTIPPTKDVMRERPRSASDFIISRQAATIIAVCSLCFFVAYLLYCWQTGGFGGDFDRHEITMFFTMFIFMQTWNLFNAKTIGTNQSAFANLRHCRGLLLVLAVIMLGQVMIVELGGQMFRCESLSLTEWVVLFCASSVVLWAGEAWRAVMRWRHNTTTVAHAAA